MSCVLPNFLLVGAAKAGTTSLYHYLNQHPQISMCALKEPKFFNAQVMKLPLRGPRDHIVVSRMIRTLADYERLFEAAGNARAVGEASPDYLFYAAQVAPLIRETLGDPRIVIVLRNPVARAHSAWRHLRRDQREPLGFEAALDEENHRRLMNWEFIWFYKACGLYSGQVRHFLDNFSRVHVALFDDMLAEPHRFMRELYAFLGVDTSFVPDVSVASNESAVRVSKWLPRFFKTNAAPMRPGTRARLHEFFRDDIRQLAALLGRDLGAWLE
jgi:hypothetical protein